MQEYLNELRDRYHNVEEEIMQAQRINNQDEQPEQLTHFTTLAEFKNDYPNSLRDLTGFDENDITEIVQVCGNVLDDNGRGRRTQLSTEDKIFYLLIFMHTNDPLTMISRILNISPQQYERIITTTAQRIANILMAHYAPTTNQFPRNGRRFNHFPNALGAVDSTLIPTVRPKNRDAMRNRYSAKHKKHGCKLQVCVNASGLCIHHFFCMNARVHDINVLRLSHAITFFAYQEQFGNQIRIRHFPLLFDKGYTGITNDMPDAIVVIWNPPNGHLNQDQEVFNQNVESDRVIVENYFARLKMKFLIFHSMFRLDLCHLYDFVKVGIALTNKDIMAHQLRE